MKRSESRILTSHTGSLPRSPAQQEALLAREERRTFDPSALDASNRAAVNEVVKMQIDTGIDIINDGEQGRSQYATYIKERLTGYEGEPKVQVWDRLDDRDFPEYAKVRPMGSQLMPQPVCSGPIAWKDFDAVYKDIAMLKAAMSDYPYSDTYMNMLCNTTSCGHFKHSCPWALAPVKAPFCRSKFWQCTQVTL